MYYINVYKTERQDHFTISYDTKEDAKLDYVMVSASQKYLHTIKVDGTECKMFNF